MSEEIQEEAVEAEAQMTPEEAVAGVESAAKSFIDMIAKASDNLKKMAEVGDEGFEGLKADLEKAVASIGATVDKVAGTAKEMIGVWQPEEAAEAEPAEEAAPAEE